MTRSVKVTVVKRGLDQDLIERLVPDGTAMERCAAFEDGQQFVFDDWPSKPVDFCDMAWQAISTGLMLCWFDAGQVQSACNRLKIIGLTSGACSPCIGCRCITDLR